MKKLYDPLPAGGAPVFTETLNDIIQTEVWDVLEGILSSVDIRYAQASTGFGTGSADSLGLIISGGEITDNGATWDLAAGIAYFPVNKVFARFPATTGIASANGALIEIDGSTTTTQKEFFDGANKNYSIEYAATVNETTIPPTPSVGAIEYAQVFPKGTGSFPNNYVAFPSLGNILKSMGEIAHDGDLLSLTPANGWGLSTAGEYRKVGGQVFIEIHGAPGSATTDVCAQIPSGYRPRVSAYSAFMGSTSNTLYPAYVNSSTGDIYIVGGQGSGETLITGNFTYLEAGFNA